MKWRFASPSGRAKGVGSEHTLRAGALSLFGLPSGIGA
jgi:hypothetical protein